MRKLFILLFLLGTVCSFAQRQMENLGRGLVAQKVSGGMYLNWRITGQEWYGTSYNLYRDGVKLNDALLSGASNYTDPGGTPQSVYTVTAVKNGVESAPSKPAIMLANGYLNIQLRELGISGYEPNDVTVADLDGDGEMEILVKRLYPNWSPSAEHFSYIEAYKLDGTFLWAINVGPNIISDVENNVAAFDLDGDGKAEVFMRTSEGTIFGDGAEIGDTNGDGITNYRSFSWGGTNGDYPNHSTYLCKGPEFLSLIDGETGKELDRTDYIPRTFGGKTMEEIWYPEGNGKGDGGHRANKFFFGAPYLDGKKPSLFISRGIYTRIVMRTYDIVDKKFKFKWEFNTDNNPAYYGQGNHNYTIADVDGDGCDEIVYGSMTVNNDGKGLYSTRLGHGDALHVGDLDPYRKGLEVWACHEHFPFGTSFRDAATGEILIRHSTADDCGRCMAANVSNDFLGSALWGGYKMFAATSREATPGVTSGGTENFNIYWDGDLLQETFDYDKFNSSTGGGEGTVYKYKNGQVSPIFKTSGALTCNWTKGTPCMQVDLFGDWREEIIIRSADNKSLRIYSTTFSTEHRIYTLLHDMQYRQAICWQMCGYNQPPHTSFFLGEREGITLPPPPVMANDKLVYSGSGAWNGGNWTLNGTPVSYTDGASLLFDADQGGTITVANGAAPELLTVNSKGDYTLQSGSLTGEMRLNKQGAGTLILNSDLLYTGPTELWEGITVLASDIQQSPVWMNRFAELNLKANVQKGMVQEYGSILRIGGNNEKAVATVSDSLWLKWGAQVDLDIYDTDFTADLLKINGDLILAEEAVLNIIPHTSGDKILPGEYLLIEVTGGTIRGDVSKLTIKGLSGIACSLLIREHKIYLSVSDTRTAASVVWKGANKDGEWNLASTQNFLNNGVEDIFVTGDQVTMNDEAVNKTVRITSDVAPSSLKVDATSAYTISGTGAYIGEGTFVKKGTGTLTINNTNTFTGKVELLEGTVVVSSLANSTSATGALGGLRSNAADFVINGATLRPNGSDITSATPMTIGENGATFNATNGIRLEGAIVGSGELVKTGGGQLALSHTSNTYTGGTVVKAGTLAMGAFNTTFGKKGSPLTLSGGTVQIFDNDNTSAVPDFNYAVTIPTGVTATLRAGSRCAINGSFSGEGNLNLYIPYVRTDIYANWSGFTGKLNVTGRDFRLCEGLDLAGTNLILGDGVYMGHFRGGSASAISATTKIGSLATNYTTVTLVNGTYNVGYNNTAATFKGVLNGVVVNKYGTGNWTLTNQNSATLTIYGGKVLANSATGLTNSGAINVRSGGVLAGSGSVKSVNVYEGGTLEAAASTILVGKFTVDGPVSLNKGKLSIKRRGSRNDNLVVKGNVTLTNAVIEIQSSVAFSDGDELPILTSSGRISGTFSVSPAIPGEGLRWNTSEFLSEGILKVEVDPTDGLHRVGAEGPKIYPTAVQDVCHVDVSGSCQGTVQLELFDASGRVVLTRSFDASEVQSIDLSGCPKGTYFLVLKAGNAKAQQTLTKL